MTTRNLAFRVVSFALLAAAWLLAPPPIFAAARVVQERAKVTVPGPAGQRVTRIAFSGNALLAQTSRVFDTTEGTRSQSVVHLYERASSSAPWVYSRIMLDTGPIPTNLVEPVTIALQGNVAVIVWGTVYVHERTGTTWNMTASLNGATRAQDVEIDAGTIVLSGYSCQMRSYRKNSAGQWRPLVNYGPTPDCSITAQDVDVSGSRIVLANPRAGSIGQQFPSSVRVFEGLNAVTPTTSITSPLAADSSFAYNVATDGNTILAADDETIGVHAFTGSTATGWTHAATLAPADNYMLGGALNFDMKGDLIAIPHPSDAQRGMGAGSVEVQRRNSDGTFTEVARLLASDASPRDSLGNDVQIDGRTVAVASRQHVYFFDVPTDTNLPTRIHDTFNSGNAANWTPTAGSNFAVVTAGPSRVYRQSSLAGNATSIRTNVDWQDQAIQADIRPTAFDGNDRWVGLVVRYQDANNYYYLTARSSGALMLKKVVNGVVSTLVAVGMPFELGRNYRIGLQAIGTRLTFFESGLKIIDYTDTSLTHGSAGFMSYKVAADFDNVVLSPTPTLALMDDNFDRQPERWTTLGDGTWNVVTPPNTNNLYEQSSVAGGARAVTGMKTKDQSVQVDVRAVGFGAGAGRWFGVMARYVDDNNYYYVTVRNDNTLSLRKLVNGAIVTLRTVPFDLTVFQWYRLRLEAIGTSLRVYVDDQLLTETTDTSFPEGRYGLVMYKAYMNYDNFLVNQQ